jgi:uncharacterized protein DUF397
LPEPVGATESWRRSTFCAEQTCVEVAEDGDRILMRDAKNTSQPSLGFDRAAWTQFVNDVKSGLYSSL